MNKLKKTTENFIEEVPGIPGKGSSPLVASTMKHPTPEESEPR